MILRNDILILINVILVEDNSRVTPTQKISQLEATVTITCNSHGESEWFVNSAYYTPDNVVLSGLYQTSLTINGVREENYGNYVCYGVYPNLNHFVARATLIKEGTVMPPIYYQLMGVVLNVCYLDNSKIKPQYAERNEGEEVTFICDIQPPMNWTMFGESLPKDIKANDTHMHIASVAVSNSGYYVCRGYNNNGLELQARAFLLVYRNFIFL